MSDKVYEEFNNISYNEDEFNLIKDSLTEVEMKKLKKNLRKTVYKTNKKHLGIAVSLALTVIMGITVVTPVFAVTIGQSIPVLDAFYERLGYYKNYKDFSQYIGLSKEENGYKFTIDKLAADEDTVIIALRINKPGLNEKAKVTDKKADFAMSSDLSGTLRGTIMSGGMEERVIDENTTAVILENQTAPGKILPKRFKLQVNIQAMFDGEVNVNFDLPVSREQTQKETLVKENLGQIIIGQDLTVKLHELSASPINTSIKFSVVGNLDNNQFINFYTYDDKGRIYIQQSGRTDDSGYVTCTLNKIEEDADKLYIIPYMEVNNNVKEKYTDKYKNRDFYNKFFSIDTKREFDFKEDGMVNVYRVEKNSDSIKFYYSLKGVQCILNKNHIIQLFENNGDKQEDKVWISTKNVKLYKINTNEPDNYCIEFNHIDSSKDFMYSVGPFSNSKVIEGTPVEVSLR